MPQTPLQILFSHCLHKVEATKPTASRNVSAEIFVMCIGVFGRKMNVEGISTVFKAPEMSIEIIPICSMVLEYLPT